MAEGIGKLIYAILNAFGEGLGGGVSLDVVFFVCYAVARLTHGIVSWLSIGMCILIVLGAIQTNAEITIGEAISDFLIVMGLSALTVQNLISIIMGKYGNIKTNSIFGGLLIGAGVYSRDYYQGGCVGNLGGLSPPFLSWQNGL